MVAVIQETKEQLEEPRAHREAANKHARREFGIERSAKAFLDAIKAVQGERT